MRVGDNELQGLGSTVTGVGLETVDLLPAESGLCCKRPTVSDKWYLPNLVLQETGSGVLEFFGVGTYLHRPLVLF